MQSLRIGERPPIGFGLLRPQAHSDASATPTPTGQATRTAGSRSPGPIYSVAHNGHSFSSEGVGFGPRLSFRRASARNSTRSHTRTDQEVKRMTIIEQVNRLVEPICVLSSHCGTDIASRLSSPAVERRRRLAALNAW